jgi:PilZ domain
MIVAVKPDERCSSSSFDQDRRAFPRKRAKAAGLYRPTDRPLARGIVVPMLNISQGGMCLLTPELFPVGTELEVEVMPAAGPGSLTVGAEVRWSAPEGNGLFRVGCRWRRQLTYAEWHRFI